MNLENIFKICISKWMFFHFKLVMELLYFVKSKKFMGLTTLK